MTSNRDTPAAQIAVQIRTQLKRQLPVEWAFVLMLHNSETTDTAVTAVGFSDPGEARRFVDLIQMAMLMEPERGEDAGEGRPS